MATASGSSAPASSTLAGFGDRDVGRGGHHRIEVARRPSVPEVPERVRLRGEYEGDVGAHRLLEHVEDAADLALLFTLREHRACRDGRVEPADPRASGADRLGEGSLRDQRRLHVAGVDGGHCLGVRREVRRDAAADPSLPQQLAEAAAGLADVVRDDRQVGRIRVLDECVDQRQRRADEAESADHHRVARADVRNRLLGAD